MANDATNVRVGLGGSKVYFDAASAGILPTDASTALPAEFLDVGHIGEDGFTYNEDLTTTTIVDSAGDIVREFVTEHNVTFEFTMLESKALVYQVYFGDTSATDSEVTLANYDGARGQWVIESIDGLVVSRFVLADAQISNKGSTPYTKDDAIGYQVTLTSYVSGGNKGKLYKATLSP